MGWGDLNFFVHVCLTVSAGRKIIIDTSQANITSYGLSAVIQGKIESRTFNGPNNGTWNYSVAAFNLTAEKAQSVFSAGNNITIQGVHALSVSVRGSFTVGTALDVSGKEVSYAADEKPLFWLGGFVRFNKSCCTLGESYWGYPVAQISGYKLIQSQ